MNLLADTFANNLSTKNDELVKPQIQISEILNKTHNDPLKSRKYKVKKATSNCNDKDSMDLTANINTNQNNLPYSEIRRPNRGIDSKSNRYRFKSYDYAPARTKSEYYPNDYKFNGDIYNDFSGGESEFDRQDPPDNFPVNHRVKPRRAYSHYQKPRELSENEEYDCPRVYEYEPDHFSSDDSSFRRSELGKTKYSSFGDCTGNYSESKPKSWAYSDNYFDRDESHKAYKSSAVINSPYRGKQPNKYINNNFSPRRSVNRPCNDMKNKNPMSLRSTYRRNENVPHSGTRLETHRNQIDKYCSGASNIPGSNFANNNYRTSSHKQESRIKGHAANSKSTDSCMIPPAHCRVKPHSDLPPSPKKESTQHHKSKHVRTEDDRYACTPRRSSIRHRSQEPSYHEGFQNANNDYKITNYSNYKYRSSRKDPSTSCTKHNHKADYQQVDDASGNYDISNIEPNDDVTASELDDDHLQSSSGSNISHVEFHERQYQHQPQSFATSFSSPKIIHQKSQMFSQRSLPRHNNLPVTPYYSKSHKHYRNSYSPPLLPSTHGITSVSQHNNPELFIPTKSLDPNNSHDHNSIINHLDGYPNANRPSKYHNPKHYHKSKALSRIDRFYKHN